MSEHSEEDPNQGKEVLSNLQQFAKFSKFQRAIMSVLTGLKADHEDLKHLRKMFHEIDTNQDGALSYEEVKNA